MSELSPRRSDGLGGVTGILVFLAGVGLLFLTFWLAFQMFAVPPSEAIKVSSKEPVELGRTAESFAQVLQRILLLLVMSAVGSVIANRGIKLYGESRGHGTASPKRDKSAGETAVRGADSPRERNAEITP